MKSALIAIILCSVNGLFAQTTYEDLFRESFEGMFVYNPSDLSPEGYMDNPPPPVPLDGGLTLLALAGGTVAYRNIRSRQNARKP